MTRIRQPTAMDLSVEEPRPMDATLAGYPWLPRMIDKARAAKAGTLGTYFKYPCPIDRECLSRLGVSSEAFAEAVARSRTDQDVICELRSLGLLSSSVEDFDPIALNRSLHGPGS
jgi:hypothetical protein